MDLNRDINDEEKYSRCWICNSLILKKREENHHLLGKETWEETTSLCVLCHDIVDRMPLDNIDIFQEMLVNVLSELKRLPSDFKWIKLYVLKIAKIIPITYEKVIKDKQIIETDKGEDLVKV